MSINEKEEFTMNELQMMVSKGEKARIIWEMFMEILGCTYEDTDRDVFQKMKQVQSDHYKAVGELGKLIGMNHTVQKKARKPRVDGGVSTSN